MPVALIRFEAQAPWLVPRFRPPLRGLRHPSGPDRRPRHRALGGAARGSSSTGDRAPVSGGATRSARPSRPGSGRRLPVLPPWRAASSARGTWGRRDVHGEGAREELRPRAVLPAGPVRSGSALAGAGSSVGGFGAITRSLGVNVGRSGPAVSADGRRCARTRTPPPGAGCRRRPACSSRRAPPASRLPQCFAWAMIFSNPSKPPGKPLAMLSLMKTLSSASEVSVLSHPM